MPKKRTLNEYRQNKDYGYTSPSAKRKGIFKSTDMNVVNEILQTSFDEGLTAEVVFFALKAMKDNPSLTVLEALKFGCEEWDI